MRRANARRRPGDLMFVFRGSHPLKKLVLMAEFGRRYAEVLGMHSSERDESHAVLRRSEFELIVNQIPGHLAAEIEITEPPVRREDGAIRLDFLIESIGSSRSLAKLLGGEIDELPPSWADGDTNFFLDHDPERNCSA